MLELGENSAAMHRSCGVFAAQHGAELLLAFGALSKNTVAGAKDAGLPAEWFPTKEALAEAVRQAAKPGDVVWFKASRGQKLEDVIRMVYGEEV